MIKNEDVRNNLYQAVNGEWEKHAVIREDRVAAGGFTDIDIEVEELLFDDVKKIVAGEIELDNKYAEHFINYYKLANDFAAREEAGAEPLRPYLEEIASYNSIADLYNDRVNVLLNYNLPFVLGVGADLNDATTNTFYFNSTKTILPDRTYYENPELGGEALYRVI